MNIWFSRALVIILTLTGAGIVYAIISFLMRNINDDPKELGAQLYADKHGKDPEPGDILRLQYTNDRKWRTLSDDVDDAPQERRNQ